MADTQKDPGTFRSIGLFSRPNLYIRRNKAACLTAAILAPLFVSLIGLLLVWLASLFDFNASAFNNRSANPNLNAFGNGFAIAIIASVFNFYFIPITVPVTWLALSQSVGRLAHRGISNKWSFLRWSAFWGALLVGGTCALPLFFGINSNSLNDTTSSPNTQELIFFFMGSVLTGGGVGTGAGTLVGLIFVAIVRPNSQLNNTDKKAIEAF